MKKIAIIPARYDSSRFPGKILAKIRTVPLLKRVYLAATNSGLFDEVLISSGDQIILNFSESIGASFYRNTKEHRCGSDRCAEAARQFSPEDMVFNIQGDEMLLPLKAIASVITEMSSGQRDLIWTFAGRFDSWQEISNPDNVKLVCDKQMNAMYFSRSVIPFATESGSLETGIFRNHRGIYGFRNETLQKLANLPHSPLAEQESLEQLRWMEYGFTIRVVDVGIRLLSVNRPEDLLRAEEYLDENG